MIIQKELDVIVGNRIRVINEHDWILEKAKIVAAARHAEYSERRPGLTLEKVEIDVFRGFLGEYAAWLIAKEGLADCQVSKPDFELHKNNQHGCDLHITRDGMTESVSVKMCAFGTKQSATWTYQPDKLSMNETFHFLMFGYAPYGANDKPPAVIELLAVKSSSEIIANLKPMKKPSGGKMAIYFEDVRNASQSF